MYVVGCGAGGGGSRSCSCCCLLLLGAAVASEDILVPGAAKHLTGGWKRSKGVQEGWFCPGPVPWVVGMQVKSCCLAAVKSSISWCACAWHGSSCVAP